MYIENGVQNTLTADVQVSSNPKYSYVQTGCTAIELLDVQKKSSSKPIDMGSSFEDLDARSSKVKTVRNLNKRFSRYFVFKLRFKKIKEKLPPTRTLPFLSLPPHFNSCCDTWRIFKQKNKGEGATWRENSGGKVHFAKGSLFLVISHTTATAPRSPCF